jgi:hypothetical protein
VPTNQLHYVFVTETRGLTTKVSPDIEMGMEIYGQAFVKQLGILQA